MNCGLRSIDGDKSSRISMLSGFYDYRLDEACRTWKICHFPVYCCGRASDKENPAVLTEDKMFGRDQQSGDAPVRGKQWHMCIDVVWKWGFMVHHACSSKMAIFVSSPHVWTNGPNYAYTYISIHIYE